MAWHDVACFLCFLAWRGMVLHGCSWHGLALHCWFAWLNLGMAWLGLSWLGMAWYVLLLLAWHGMAWHGMFCMAIFLFEHAWFVCCVVVMGLHGMRSMTRCHAKAQAGMPQAMPRMPRHANTTHAIPCLDTNDSAGQALPCQAMTRHAQTHTTMRMGHANARATMPCHATAHQTCHAKSSHAMTCLATPRQAQAQ